VANLFSRVTGKGSKLAELLPGLAGAMPTIRPQRRWSLLCLGMWLESRSVTW
jgi:hypothetical protein